MLRIRREPVRMLTVCANPVTKYTSSMHFIYCYQTHIISYTFQGNGMQSSPTGCRISKILYMVYIARQISRS